MIAVMIVAAIALTIMTAGTAAGPVICAVMLAATVFYAVDNAVAQATNKPTLEDQLFATVSQACGNAGGAAVNMILSVLLSGGNPLLFMQMAFSDANVIGGFVAACGGSQQQQMIATAAIQAAIMIAATIAVVVLTAGTGAPAVFEEFAEGIEAIAKALNVSEKGVQIAITCATTAISCAQVAADGITLNNDLLMAKIDMMKGGSDAMNEEMQAVVDCLRALVKKLLDMLSGNTQGIVNINNSISSMYSAASDINTQITSAIAT
jgi:hypothetical protein